MWSDWRRPRIFLSYSHSDNPERVRRLERRLRRKGYTVISQDNAFPAGRNWHTELGPTVRDCDAVLALISKATAKSRYQMVEISIAFEQGTLIPILVDAARLPDIIRTTQAIRVESDRDWKRVVEALGKFLRSARKGRSKPRPFLYGPVAPPRATASEPAVPRIALISRQLVPWYRHIKRDPFVGGTLDHVLRQLNRCLQLPGNYKVAHPMVRHIARVLQHLNGLCLGPFAQQIEPAGIPGSAEQYFCATVAALAHNIALLNDLPFQRSGQSPRLGYSERYKQFVPRTEAAYAFLGHGLDRRAHQLLETAMCLGFEMARDSAYWVDGAALLEPDDRYLRAMARNLRRADAMDVGHRIVRDLVHQLFDHLGYEDGFTCFLLHAFLPGKPGLLEDSARLEGNTLIVPVPKFDGIGLAGKRDATLSVLPLANRLVIRLTELALRRIDAERGLEADSPLRVRQEPVAATMSRERHEALTWAFFALALIEPLSDTEAAMRAAALIPKLVGFIQQSDPKWPSAGLHTVTQTADLLARLPRLRRRSHALRHVCELARAESVHLLEPGFVVNPGALALHQEDRRMARVESCAEILVTFGNSRPVARCVAEFVRRKPSASVYTYHCVRHCVWHRSSGNMASPEILESVDVARAMTGQVKQAMHELNVRPPASLDEPPLDWTMLFKRMVKASRRSGKQIELLLGTRGFQMPASRRGAVTFVGIYGSLQILESCRAKGVHVRLVTSEDALRNVDTELPPADGSSAFSMTYSRSAVPNLEDEPIPLILVDAITTEKATYTRAEVEARLKRCAGAAGFASSTRRPHQSCPRA
jgi:hypothetical protein